METAMAKLCFWGGERNSAIPLPLSFRRCPSISNPLLVRQRFSLELPRQRFLPPMAVVKKSPKRLKYSTPRFSKGDHLLYVEVDPSGKDTWKLDPVIDLLKKGAVGVIPTDTVYAIVCDLRSHDAIERLRRIKDIEASKARRSLLRWYHFSCCSSYLCLVDLLGLVVVVDRHSSSRILQNTHCMPLCSDDDISASSLQPLSILCRSFRDIDTYTTGFPRGNAQGQANIFRAVKHCLPGPYTFILTANKELPRQCTKYGTTAARYASRRNVGVRMPDDPICQAILAKMDAPLISTSVKSQKQDEWILDPVIIADVYRTEGLDFVVDGGLRVADPSTVVDMTGSSPTIIRLGKGPKQSWMVAEDDKDFDLHETDLVPNAV